MKADFLNDFGALKTVLPKAWMVESYNADLPIWCGQVAQLDRRVNEAANLGFKACIVPKHSGCRHPIAIKCATLGDALRLSINFGKKTKEEPGIAGIEDEHVDQPLEE